MAELSKQEKKILDAKLKKASKQLIKEGFDKKEIKKLNVDSIEVDESKDVLSLGDDEFLNLVKGMLDRKDAPSNEEEAPEQPAEDAQVEETTEEKAEEEPAAEDAKEEEKANDLSTLEWPDEETNIKQEIKEAEEEEKKITEEAPVLENKEEEVKEAQAKELAKEEEKPQEEEKTEEVKQEEFEKQVEELIGKDLEEEKEEEKPVEEKAEDKKQEKKKAEPKNKKASSKKEAPLKKKDEDEEDEEDDNEEDKEEDAALQGYNKKVLLKLKIASDRTQRFYSDLRNELRSYKALKFKSNNTGDTYSYKGRVVFKVTIFPKALKVYYALKPQDFDVKKYHHKDVKDIKRYESIPLLFRIASDRGYKYALEFLSALAKKLKVAKTKVKPFDYMPDFNTTSKALLIENGGENLLRSSCTKDHSDIISDGLAKKCMMLRVRKPIEGEKNIAEISIGELSAAFKTSYKIDIDLLKKVGLVKKDANYLKVTAMNNCYKAISISADEYEPEVIRMVVVTGGNITRLVK